MQTRLPAAELTEASSACQLLIDRNIPCKIKMPIDIMFNMLAPKAAAAADGKHQG
jgi:hypothetical protein